MESGGTPPLKTPPNLLRESFFNLLRQISKNDPHVLSVHSGHFFRSSSHLKKIFYSLNLGNLTSDRVSRKSVLRERLVAW